MLLSQLVLPVPEVVSSNLSRVPPLFLHSPPLHVTGTLNIVSCGFSLLNDCAASEKYIQNNQIFVKYH